MTIGAALYAAVMSPVLVCTPWPSISTQSWILMTLSAVFALAVAYLIWYTAVQRLGSTRTSMYSYLTPIAAMLVAAVWLGEPVTGRQVAGAGAIFSGLFITRRTVDPPRVERDDGCPLLNRRSTPVFALRRGFRLPVKCRDRTTSRISTAARGPELIRRDRTRPHTLLSSRHDFRRGRFQGSGRFERRTDRIVVALVDASARADVTHRRRA